jgi:hypothetical protein
VEAVWWSNARIESEASPWQRVGLYFQRVRLYLRQNDSIHESSPRDRLRVRPVGAVVRRFRYFCDELFLTAAIGYAVNRWVVKPLVTSAFLRGHFNDLLLIPAALPVILWVQRRTGLRSDDGMPSWSEIALHLVVWSVICEFIGPIWLHRGTADLWDVAAYFVGGLAAGFWWNHRPKAKSEAEG